MAYRLTKSDLTQLLRVRGTLKASMLENLWLLSQSAVFLTAAVCVAVSVARRGTWPVGIFAIAFAALSYLFARRLGLVFIFDSGQLTCRGWFNRQIWVERLTDVEDIYISKDRSGAWVTLVWADRQRRTYM